MAAPTAAVAARFAWVGYRDRIPFLGRKRSTDETADPSDDTTGPALRIGADAELVDVGSSPPR